jgi:TPR repeat protein
MEGPLVGQDGRAEGQQGQSKLEVAHVLRTKMGYTALARALLEVAARDDASAMEQMACSHRDGDWGVKHDKRLAHSWMLRAACAGVGAAMCAVSQYYHDGMGCEKNEELASLWREKAEESGDPLVRATLLRQPDHVMVAAVIRLAEGGNPRAQCQLGLYYQLGRCVKQDMGKAVEWTTRAAEQNVTLAQYMLGEVFSNGTAGKRDGAKAFYWYERAAIQGLVAAMIKVCHGYREGWVPGPEETKKMRWAEWMWRAARGGHAEAKDVVDRFPPTHADHCAEMWARECVRSSVWWDRNRLAFDTAETFEWLEVGARRGDAWSQYRLGRCLVMGEYGDPDDVRAFHLIASAAEQGNGDARLAHAYLIHEGIGVARNVLKALECATLACEQGCERSSCLVGSIMYRLCGSVRQRDAAAVAAAKGEEAHVTWFLTDAIRGHAQAQFMLGNCYAYGQGVDRDDAEAVKWFTKAAEGGFAPAQVCLGVRLKRGLGVAKDEVKAAEWFAKAAESNDMDGLFQLGVCRMKGQGVAQDADEGVRLFLEACRKKDPFAARCGVACGAAGLGMPKNEAEALVLLNMAVCERGKGTLEEVRAMGRDPMRVIDECEVFASVRPLLWYTFAPWQLVMQMK